MESWREELYHHGIKGQKWGIKNGPPYPISNSNNTVFISGSSKTQDVKSEYYRKKLPKDIRNKINDYIKDRKKIIVGDAPGIDRQVQDYLKKKHYKNVEVYGPGEQVRYSANKKWKTNPIDAPEHEPGSKEWLAKKDIAMTNAANEGLAIILDKGSKATRNNVNRLLNQNKDVTIYQINRSLDQKAHPDGFVKKQSYIDFIGDTNAGIKYKHDILPKYLNAKNKETFIKSELNKIRKEYGSVETDYKNNKISKFEYEIKNRERNQLEELITRPNLIYDYKDFKDL